jgi:ethanolamine phosphate transferase 2 subunit G
LLHRNALQIFDIVQATFPTLDYQSAHDKTDCHDPSTTGQDLACKWRKAMDLIKSTRKDIPARDDGIESVAALMEVSSEFALQLREK